MPDRSLSCERDRSGKERCHHPGMHFIGNLDGPVVPEKSANKAGTQTAAEFVVERNPVNHFFVKHSCEVPLRGSAI
jgi:hypothetical protein